MSLHPRPRHPASAIARSGGDTVLRLTVAGRGLVVLLPVLFVACSMGGIPSASPSLAPLPMPPPAAQRSPDTITEGVYRFYPNSAAVKHGRPYRFQLYTHCWERMLIDLDGSFWAVDDVIDHDGEVPLEYDTFDQGTIVIDASDSSRAVYISDGGDMTLHLRRRSGPLEIPICV